MLHPTDHPYFFRRPGWPGRQNILPDSAEKELAPRPPAVTYPLRPLLTHQHYKDQRQAGRSQLLQHAC